jgi:Uma2 family endonuclease
MATGTATDMETTLYPESDGQPMAESHVHRQLMFDIIPRLEERYAAVPDVYVNGNMFVYFQQQPVRALCPDIFVAFGVSKEMRPSFLTWVEGVFPSVVFEFTSTSTAKVDQGEKLETYRDIWKVKEYFLFDPREEYLDPPLQGFRRSRGKFLPIRLVKGQLASKELGITLEHEGPELILRDAKTGKRLLNADKKETAAERTKRLRAEAALDRAEAGRVEADAEIARLKAELDALRKAK